MSEALELAAATVRKLKSEIVGAETQFNFHMQMASSAESERKTLQRNLEQAEKVLIREAQKTPGAPVPGPRKNTTTITKTKVS